MAPYQPAATRQQISFGRKQAKQCRAVRLQGIVCFAEAMAMSETGANKYSPGFACFAAQRPVRKEASLLT